MPISRSIQTRPIFYRRSRKTTFESGCSACQWPFTSTRVGFVVSVPRKRDNINIIQGSEGPKGWRASTTKDLGQRTDWTWIMHTADVEYVSNPFSSLIKPSGSHSDLFRVALRTLSPRTKDEGYCLAVCWGTNGRGVRKFEGVDISNWLYEIIIFMNIVWNN